MSVSSETLSDPSASPPSERAAEKKFKVGHRFRGFLPVVVDVETGGFNSQTDALLEVAAVILGVDEHGNLVRRETCFAHVTPFPGANIEKAALEITGKIERARKWADGRGLTLRGTFGEGSKIWGHLHQLSNQITLGLDEAEILMDVENAALEICTMERQARAMLPNAPPNPISA